MKIHAIVRKQDKKIAMSLVGIEAVCVNSSKELKQAYQTAILDKSIVILAIDSNFFDVLNLDTNKFIESDIEMPIIIAI